MSEPPEPKVLVLLATHNGAAFLGAQLDSILAQEGVDLRVLAADDASTDGTAELLEARAAVDPRLTVIRRTENSGGAAPNFYDLLLRAPVDDGTFVAFADQDDIWRPGKLARHAAVLADGEIDAVSSNVIAFGDGGRHLIRKDYPQRRFDYLFEGPGPGCTHLMSPRLVGLVRAELQRDGSPAPRTDFHDWLVYAVCRAAGLRWHIDPEPTVEYRQHGGNVFGANVGFRSASIAARAHEAALAPHAGGPARPRSPSTSRSPRIAPSWNDCVRSWLTLRCARGSPWPRDGAGCAAARGTRWPLQGSSH